MINLVHVSEGLRIFKRRMAVAIKGAKRYTGDAEQICTQIVAECWNGKFFQASTGHFRQFYTRDFGICVDSLLKLGYKSEAAETLQYALKIFEKQNRVATAITPSGKAFDFPYYAPDSLVFLIRSLRVLAAKGLAKEHSDFLNNEINKFYETVMEHDSGLVKGDRFFSSLRDYARRKSSCYDNVMVAVLGHELKKLHVLINPLKKYDFKKILKKNFWSGEYFFDDLTKKGYVAGDANVFPFWCEVFDDKKMLKKAVSSVQKSGLDKPFPLRYAASKQEMIWLDFFVRGYEQDKVWMHMGPLYVQLLKKVDPQRAAEHMDTYTNVIERYKNFFEVFEPTAMPFKTPFYYADEGMLWAANYLRLLK
jgi:hypothetical protein